MLGSELGGVARQAEVKRRTCRSAVKPTSAATSTRSDSSSNTRTAVEAVENYFALGGRKKSKDVNEQQFVSYNTCGSR